MVLFWRQADFIVKMTKCRQVVHTMLSREVVVQIPPGSRQQADFCDPSSSGLSAVFSTDHVLNVLHLIMTETGIWDGYSNEACGRSIWVNSRSILGQF